MALNLLQKRVEKERRWLPVIMPRSEGKDLISSNTKTTLSLDFPVCNCRATKVCAKTCYACQGYQNFRQGIERTLQLHKLILADPIRAAERVTKEARGRLVRISGSGEIEDQEEYKAFFTHLKKNKVRLFGFTRKPDVYLWMKKLGYPMMFSLDAGTRESDIEFVKKHVRIKARAWLATREDPKPPIPVMVTFPQHGPQTPWYKKIAVQDTDCPAVRKKLHCDSCQICYLDNQKLAS